MGLDTFCVCQRDRVRAWLDGWEQIVIRRQWISDWQVERARLWAIVQARVNCSPGIARDIREGRVER